MILSEIVHKTVAERSYKVLGIESLFIAMRHGNAQYTYEEDHGGDIVEGTLSEEGEKRVSLAADEIMNMLRKKHVHKVQLVSSPKRRCLESLKILEKFLTHANIEYEKIIEPNFRDVKVIGPSENILGSYQRWETDMRDGENWFASWKRKTQEGMKFYEGEESPKDIEDRVRQVLPKHVKSAIPVIVICHEEILGAIADIYHHPWTRPTYGEVWYFEKGI